MNKHIELSKQSKKLLFSGITAAALALVVGGPHAVKADSVSGSTLAAQSLNTKTANDNTGFVSFNKKADYKATKDKPSNKVAESNTDVNKDEESGKINTQTQANTTDTPAKVTTKESESIDDWMPDQNLQKVIAYSLYSDDSETGVAKVTKDDLANMTSLNLDVNHAEEDPYYYLAYMNIQSLEGLQYATKLESINLSPSIDLNLRYYGTALVYSTLYDISALKDLNNLSSVVLQQCQIRDISALANKPKLYDCSISYNAITDFSPLGSDENLRKNGILSAYYQAGAYSPLGVSQKAPYITVTYPPFIDVDGSQMTIRIANDDNEDHFASAYLSKWKDNAGQVTADGQHVVWDLSGLPVGYKGFMTINFKGNSGAGGYLIYPFEITD